jgi:hypothetical protein
VRKVDLSIELQILAFHEQRKGGHALPQAGDAPAESDGGGKTADGSAGKASAEPSTLDSSLIDTGIPS